MCVWKPGEGNTLLGGLAHPLVAKIGEAGFVEASGAVNQTGEFQDHLDTSRKCKLKDQEADNGSGNAGNGHGMQSSEENVVVPKEINLSGVLDSLMSLDLTGDFMGPFDGFSAPNHSKIVEASMCFAMMQEKIRTQKYSTWRMFVEDFEWICHNALRCNHKRSIIWAAANNLLLHGEKCLEQYERWGESLVALNKTGGSHASLDSKLGVPSKCKFESVEARVCQLSSNPSCKGLKMAIPSNTTGSAESKPPSSGAASMCKDAAVRKDTSSIQRSKEQNREDQMTRSVAPFLAPVLDVVSEETSAQKDVIEANVSREVGAVDSRHRVLDSSLSPVGQEDEYVDVEEERDVVSDDYRTEFDGEATESSSSYDSAGSALEGEVGSERMQSMFEADSGFRDGNGAGGLVEDDDGLLTNERVSKALDPVWKQHRRGIEWRCRWLELQTKAIQAKLSLYDKSLKSLQSAKIWKCEGGVGEGTSARTVPVKILRNHPVFHRKHRRRAEHAEGDLDLGRHPVFSRYEKRKTQRKSDDGLAQEKVAGHQVQQTGFEKTIFEKVDMKQQPAADNAFVGHDSMELYLFEIEELQARVRNQMQILKDPGLRRSNSVSSSGVPSLSPRAHQNASQRGTLSAQALSSQRAAARGGTPSSSHPGGARTGSGSSRRRSSDYDINNVIMPVNMGSGVVQEVRHLDIETPRWRLVEDAVQDDVGQESSSDEETEDGNYQTRHARMEALEQEQRNMFPLKRSADETRTVGRGKSSIKMAGEGSGTLALPSVPAPSDPLSAENVPKKQRTKWNSVRRQSQLPPVAPIPRGSSSAAQARPLEDVAVKPDGKTEASVKDTDVDLSGVESGDPAKNVPTTESMKEE